MNAIPLYTGIRVTLAGVRLLPFGALLLIALLIKSGGYSANDDTCVWQQTKMSIEHTESFSLKAPEVFWINMDKSKDRRKHMQQHLDEAGYLHRRVKGLSIAYDLYFPADIKSNWDKITAKIMTDEVIPPRSKARKFLQKIGGVSTGSISRNYSHIVAGLIGRSKKNHLKEVGCTASHLEAMRQAIYNNRSSSPYALIVEDDIFIPFNIDFDAVVRSAPSQDFGILQLFNSNEESMHSLWMNYVKKGTLWAESHQKQAASYWSTCAYLINREVMKPIIDKIAYAHQEWVYLKIVAGIVKPCRPKLTACCEPQPGYSYRFVHEPPCIWAAKGFQADSFIYALAKTYVITVPLITNSAAGNQSTFHQDHVVSIHQSAFARQRQYINELIQGRQALPEFITKACTRPLRINSVVLTGGTESPNTAGGTCVREDKAQSIDATPVYWISTAADSPQSRNMRNYLSQVVRLPTMEIDATTVDHLFLPEDIQSTWDGRGCKYQSTVLEPVAAHTSTEFITSVHLPAAIQRKISQHASTFARGNDLTRNAIFVVSGLCGRGKGQNNLIDLSIAASHLYAMHTAVRKYEEAKELGAASYPPVSRYALILEDDVQIIFDLDFTSLASTAPADFGILRLFTSHMAAEERMWRRYQRDKGDLWSTLNDKLFDSWATKAYVIDCEVLAPVLKSIMKRISYTATAASTATPLQIFDLKVIAGLKSPCIPAACCNFSSVFHTIPPCFESTAGFLAQKFIFKLAPSYVLHVPLVTSNLNGIHSLLHGTTLGITDMSALGKHREYMDEMIAKPDMLPSFARLCNSSISWVGTAANKSQSTSG